MCGLYGTSANRVWGKDFFYTYKQWGGTFFRKHIYGKIVFFVHFCASFFTLDTICADHKDKPMAGFKNQLIKKCLTNFSS